jgi:hypothetical protein
MSGIAKGPWVSGALCEDCRVDPAEFSIGPDGRLLCLACLNRSGPVALALVPPSPSPSPSPSPELTDEEFARDMAIRNEEQEDEERRARRTE